MFRSGKIGRTFTFGPNESWYLSFGVAGGFAGPLSFIPRPLGMDQFVQAEACGVMREGDRESYMVRVQNLRNEPVEFEMWWMGDL